jgi:hypothetical protein
LRGVVNALSDSDAGLEFEATLADTRASKDAVALLKAGAYDSVSVGANPVQFKFDKQGVMVVSKAHIIEISLVAVPAFSEAVITEIAASADPEESEEEETLDTPEEEKVSEAIKAESEESATTPTTPILYAQTKREFKLPSAAEYMCKFVAGGAEFAEFNSRIHAAAPDVQRLTCRASCRRRSSHRSITILWPITGPSSQPWAFAKCPKAARFSSVQK